MANNIVRVGDVEIMMLSSPRARSSDQPLNCSWSSTGTPSISQITLTGIGYANSSIRSMVPASRTPSRRPSTICWTRGRSPSTTRGVNALLTRLRRRVWSGGSRSSIDRPMAGIGAPKRAATKAAIASFARRGSRSAATTSSYRVSTQNPIGL